MFFYFYFTTIGMEFPRQGHNQETHFNQTLNEEATKIKDKAQWYNYNNQHTNTQGKK